MLRLGKGFSRPVSTVSVPFASLLHEPAHTDETCVRWSTSFAIVFLSPCGGHLPSAAANQQVCQFRRSRIVSCGLGHCQTPSPWPAHNPSQPVSLRSRALKYATSRRSSPFKKSKPNEHQKSEHDPNAQPQHHRITDCAAKADRCPSQSTCNRRAFQQNDAPHVMRNHRNNTTILIITKA